MQTIARMEEFFKGYATFKEPGIRLVLALWCACTHAVELFDAFPYVVITSSTKRSGKTRASELIGFLSCNTKAFAAMTPATMFQVINPPNQVHLFEGEEKRKKPTVIFDEAEVLSSEAANTMRAVLNVGYRKGQSIPRMVNQVVYEYDTYCPKVFVLIGDVYDTLRDRSIVVEMERADTPRRFSFEEAKSEALELKGLAVEQLKASSVQIVDAWKAVETRWLPDRDAEIWRPIFAACMVFCPERLPELQRTAADVCASKTATKKRHTNMDMFETEAQNDEYARRLLRDVQAVFTAEPTVHRMYSSDLLERLHALPVAPWRRFKGEGLNVHGMADLLSRFGVHPKSHRSGKEVKRGYTRSSVMKAKG